MNYAELEVLKTIHAEEFQEKCGCITLGTTQDGVKLFKFEYNGKERIGMVADDYEEGRWSSISSVKNTNTDKKFLLLHNDSRYRLYDVSDDIKALRKMGQLQEAYAKAVGRSLLLYNKWYQTTFFWVLYDLCKQFLKKNNEEARKHLDMMRRLLPTMKDDTGIGKKCFERLEEQLRQQGFREAGIIATASELSKTDPKAAYNNVRVFISSPGKADESFHEKLGWILYRYIKDIFNAESSNQLWTLIQCYLKFSNERPSLLHSMMLSAAIKVVEKNGELRFHDFFRLWGSENLRDEDWKKNTDGKGNVYRSLAAKAIHLCYESVERTYDYRENATTEWIAALYDILLAKEGDDKWLERNRAKIHVWQGHKEEAVKIYKHLLRELSDKYYIWGELAELTDDLDLRIGLFSKALSVEKNEIYLGSIRLGLSEALIEKGLMAEALFELKTYKKSTDKNGQKISHKYTAQTKRINQDIQPTANNNNLYAKYVDMVDENLWENLRSGYGYVEYVNEAKGVLHIVTTDSEQLFVPRRKAKGTIKKGSYVSFRYYTTTKRTEVVNIKVENGSVVLPYFSEAIVAVNNINSAKNLFGFTLGEGKLGGCVHYEDTPLRPSLGQCLKIHYFIGKNKKGFKTIVAISQEETEQTNKEAVRVTRGTLRVKWYDDKEYTKESHYGIIYTEHNKTYMVRGALLAKHGITEDCRVKARVVYCGNGSKSNWFVINIERL